MRPHLQLLGAPGGRCQGDVLQLFDALAEVRHPLDDSHPSGHRVVGPAPGQDPCSTVRRPGLSTRGAQLGGLTPRRPPPRPRALLPPPLHPAYSRDGPGQFPGQLPGQVSLGLSEGGGPPSHPTTPQLGTCAVLSAPGTAGSLGKCQNPGPPAPLDSGAPLTAFLCPGPPCSPRPGPPPSPFTAWDTPGELQKLRSDTGAERKALGTSDPHLHGHHA